MLLIKTKIIHLIIIVKNNLKRNSKNSLSIWVIDFLIFSPDVLIELINDYPYCDFTLSEDV